MGIDQIFNLDNQLFGAGVGVGCMGIIVAMTKKATQVSTLYWSGITNITSKMKWQNIYLLLLKKNFAF